MSVSPLRNARRSRSSSSPSSSEFASFPLRFADRWLCFDTGCFDDRDDLADGNGVGVGITKVSEAADVGALDPANPAGDKFEDDDDDAADDGDSAAVADDDEDEDEDETADDDA